MKKILISDIQDTLLPNNPNFLNFLYGTDLSLNLDNFDEIKNHKKYIDSLDRKYNQELVNHLENFFKDGNELVAVTSSYHITLEYLFKFYIQILFQLFPKYKDLIQIYIKGDIRKVSLLTDYGTVEKKDNNIILNIDGIDMNYIFEKADVFNTINTSDSHLFAIGDDGYNDMEMLIKTIELGGKASLIDYYLSNPNFEQAYDKNELIKSLLNQKYYLIKENEIPYSMLSKEKFIKLEKEFEAKYYPLKFKEKKLYQEKLNNGEISLRDIYILDHLYDEFIKYNNNRKYNKGLSSITDISYIESLFSKLDVYSSFYDYHEKVLKK